MKKVTLILLAAVLLLFTSHTGFAAYNHAGDADSATFRSVYPDKVGTKLDNCTLCHGGGSYLSGGKTTTLGSCQWCHYVTNYGADLTDATLVKTLNPYGADYKGHGRNASALQAITPLDSDGDTFTNGAEIVALTFPGDAKDNPGNVPAPSIVISIKQFEDMPLHTQFLLMNASKSDDSYTQYSGVALENLIKAVMLDSATGITVYSPDGFSTYHPFTPSTNPNSYHVFGIYPEGTFYYNERADIAKYPADPPNYAAGGWCDYSSPSAGGRENGSAIFNAEGLKMILAFERDGDYLTPGVLNSQNKLDGEGPFRVVPPQKNPGPPDQRSSSTNQNVIWPYVSSADHNAGFSSRTVTIIRVEPLPIGTTDINTLEAGWPYVDEEKIVIYGSIAPNSIDNLNGKIDSLIETITSQDDSAFKARVFKIALVNKIKSIKKQVGKGAYSKAVKTLKEDVLKKMDGFLLDAVDRNDWVIDLAIQQQLRSQIQQIWVMLVLMGG
jgi:hypothetical protein